MLNQKEYERRVLIIDDNEAIHTDFTKILAPDERDSELDELEALCLGVEGENQVDAIRFTLAHAFQGESGLTAVTQAVKEKKPFDMAFVDMRMPPGWDGLETIEHLWQVDPELEVVICTAYSDHSWHDIVKRLGQSHHLLILKKPFDSAEVLQMALALTEKRRLARIAAMRMGDVAEAVAERTEGLRKAKDDTERMLEDILSIVGETIDESTVTAE